jgi:hypothetical protein
LEQTSHLKETAGEGGRVGGGVEGGQQTCAAASCVVSVKLTPNIEASLVVLRLFHYGGQVGRQTKVGCVACGQRFKPQWWPFLLALPLFYPAVQATSAGFQAGVLEPAPPLSSHYLAA